MIQPGAAILSVTATLLSAFAPIANADPDEVDSLDEIVVTATRIESPVREVARSVSVVNKAAIQNAQQLLGLDESLAAVPGLYMQNRYNFAQDLKISLRGFGARSSFGIRGIRIFVDDIPETLPDGQAQVDSIDLGSTNRIEVLRGPASSLYGNAAGGVIAIYSELGESDPYIEASLAGGDYDYQRYQLKTAGSYRAADYMLSGSSTAIDGYREFSEAHGTAVNGKVAIQLSERDELILATNFTDQPEAQDAGGLNAAEVAADRQSARALNVQFDAGEALSQQRIGGVYKTDRFGGDLMLRNYYVWRDFTNLLPFVAGGAVDLQRFFYGAGAQYSFSPPASNRFRLTAGFDVDRQDDDRKRYDNNDGTPGALVFDQNESVDSNGAFLQGQYALDDRWSFSAGLRFDEVKFDISDNYLINGNDSGSLDFDQWSPSLAVSAETAAGVLFASWSSSFETPTTTELANPDGSGGFNESLQPQTADNYEVGYKASQGAFVYEATLFHIDLENELIPFELASSPGRTFYSNAGSSTRNGAELSAAWRISDAFSASLSYTWSDFTFDEFIEDGADYSGKRLPGLPENFAYLGLTYSTSPGVTGTLEILYSGDLYASNDNSTRLSQYTVSNFRVSYELHRRNWTVRPFLSINNLFDELYNSNVRINAFGGRYYEPAPERNFYAGIVVNFRKAAVGN